MRIRTPLLLCALAVVGCQAKKTEPVPGVAVQPENLPPTPDAGKGEPARVDPTTAPAAGAIKGKPFKPDRVKLQGPFLEFRTGPGPVPDASIVINLSPVGVGKLEGKTLTFNGEAGAPIIDVAEKAQGNVSALPMTVLPHDHTLTLKITRRTRKTIEGTIDLKVKSLPDTHLLGAFAGEAEKAATDPLDADDAPYVRGELKLVGPPPEEKVQVGFVARETGGKEQSNSVYGTLYRAGKPTRESATTPSTAPQLTTVMSNEAGPPEYRHTRLPPGDYLVYVKVGDVMAAWKRLPVKAGDQLTADLTVDPKTFGEVVVTIPDEEARSTSERHLALVPADALDLRAHYAFEAAEVKKGQTKVTVKGVPAGKYRAVRGESEADVEVAAGKSVAVTLVRAKK
jgi:hypothetical protein